MYQIWENPDEGSSHSRSGCPSLLKSPTDTTCQTLLLVILAADISTLPPGPPRNHTSTAPLTGSCHTTSGVPLPSKSPIPTMCHGFVFVRSAAPSTVTPCDPPRYQT